MSFKRRKSLRDSEKELRHERGPNGFRLCRWCKREVSPPRKTFCSDACVHEWKLRSSGKYLRENVYRRDLGRCNSCKVDTRLQKIALEDSLSACSYDEKHLEYSALIASLVLTRSEAKKSLWQADHVKPVEDGGGECGIENMQTLCIACHKKKTGRQASYRGQPHAIKPLGAKRLPGLDGLKGFKGVNKKFE